MDTSRFHTDEGRLEQGFGASESFVTDRDNLSVGKFVGFLQTRATCCSLHLLFEVKSNITELLFNVSDDFPFCSGGERVTTFGQDLHQVIREITTSQIQTNDGVRESISFIDGYSVGYTITRIQDNTSGTTRSIQRQDSLNSNVHGRRVEGLEHDLRHLLPVSFRIKWSFGQQDGMFFGSDSKFIVEGMMPDLLHIIPVCYDSMFNRVLQCRDTSLTLSFITDITVLLSHTDHDTLMTGTSNN